MAAGGPERVVSVTRADLQRWKVLAVSATPGPWRYDGVDIDQLTDAGKGYPLDAYPDSHTVVVGKCECGNLNVAIMRRDDAAFIAESRVAVPALIAEVERLRAALREACDLADEANGDPSQCSHNVPIGERIDELRKVAGQP